MITTAYSLPLVSSTPRNSFATVMFAHPRACACYICTGFCKELADVSENLDFHCQFTAFTAIADTVELVTKRDDGKVADNCKKIILADGARTVITSLGDEVLEDITLTHGNNFTIHKYKDGKTRYTYTQADYGAIVLVTIRNPGREIKYAFIHGLLDNAIGKQDIEIAGNVRKCVMEWYYAPGQFIEKYSVPQNNILVTRVLSDVTGTLLSLSYSKHETCMEWNENTGLLTKFLCRCSHRTTWMWIDNGRQLQNMYSYGMVVTPVLNFPCTIGACTHTAQDAIKLPMQEDRIYMDDEVDVRIHPSSTDITDMVLTCSCNGAPKRYTAKVGDVEVRVQAKHIRYARECILITSKQRKTSVWYNFDRKLLKRASIDLTNNNSGFETRYWTSGSVQSHRNTETLHISRFDDNTMTDKSINMYVLNNTDFVRFSPLDIINFHLFDLFPVIVAAAPTETSNIVTPPLAPIATSKVITSSLVPIAEPATATSIITNSEEQQSECVICMDNPKDTVLIPCAHMCMCSACADMFVAKECPICRTVVASVVKIYVC